MTSLGRGLTWKVLVSVTALLLPTAGMSQNGLWVTAYYAGWEQGWYNNGNLPAEEIDYSAITDIVHFSVVPKADGTIDTGANSITSVNSAALISSAHAAGKKVLICVGGWGSESAFQGATSPLILPLFVTNLVNFMTSRGYDGIDVDWEVLSAADGVRYAVFLTALRTALDLLSPRPLLTAATGWQPPILAQVQNLLDQVNLMTYDMSGAWPGWVTWHNAPIYDGGFRFPSTGNPVPSTDATVQTYRGAGIPAGKLGIGVDFYGYVWSGGIVTPTQGVTAPRETWSTAPTVQSNVPYSTIMQMYYQPRYYRWDSLAQASYLSIATGNPSTDKFISYDDENTIRKKFDYVRQNGLGGLFIWELGGGFRADQPAGKQDALLQAVKASMNGTSGVTSPSDSTLPPGFRLTQNYPNPFNPATTVRFVVPTRAHVTLKVYNALGQEIATLVDGEMPAGNYARTWNAAGFPSGIYFCRMEADNFVDTKRMVLIK